eukprot:TRINITY_DN40610_c0_g1_i1.p1 TRINITY_DN40610_c0_g1~~TRINITY_DN40610_c0_g1_i1.p1  ORF type:complete len:1525 (+),score=439.03 TRINITY_DN40610_c0_g1_i1:526-4575(+)
MAQELEDTAAAAGLFIVGEKMFVPTRDEVELLCQEEYGGTADHSGALGSLQIEPGCLAMVFEGRGAVGKLQLMVGPLNSGTARDRAPATLRAKWGTDSTSNGIHASLNCAAAEKELKCIFPPGTLSLQRTLCVVKPDAISNIIAIKAAIEDAGFTILTEKHTTLCEERAQEFYRALKDHPSFAALVKEACSGPCCAMVLCRLEAVSVWNQLMGPSSVKDARKLRPNSIRARFGRDGQRNAVHGSESVKTAAREIRFFFPEMGADPAPDESEVCDFLFRKSSVASMDLKTLDNTDPRDFEVDPTLQQLLSKGLMELCQVQPKGLEATEWLSGWLASHNPNEKKTAPAGAPAPPFNPPERTQKFVEYGVNQDGMTFTVEAPRDPVQQKPIVEVDVAAETSADREPGLSMPPFVVFVSGGPGCGKGTQCQKIKDEFNMVHLSTGDLMRAEVEAATYLGTEIEKCMKNGALVPDDITLKLLKKAMMKHQDTNRFLLDGFPRSVEQAKRFEQEIAEVAFMLYLETSEETMKARIMGRAGDNPERVDDNPETIAKRLKTFEERTLPLLDYYSPIGKIRKVSADGSVDEVNAEAKKLFKCRCLYLLGPPGAPVEQIAERMESKYGYSAINIGALLKAYGDSNAVDAPQVKEALSKGKTVEASIACPLVLSEIYRDMAIGVQNFVLCDFPQSLKQVQFLENRIPSISKTLVLDFSRADAQELQALAANKGGDALQIEVKANAFFGAETKEMLSRMTNVERMPTCLSDLSSTQKGCFEEQLVEGTWQAVKEKVQPGVTIVLGLPGSGTNILAQTLAQRVPNTQAVDCSQLLDKELERKTDMGLTMHNMLAKGQVVPLSMTLELLKGVTNLTCSDTLVIENCPMYSDQIELLQEEFRIDRVFYIEGNDKAVMTWKETFMKSKSEESSMDAAQAFNERLERLPPIVSYFSKIGKLEKFEVSETPKQEKLQEMVEKVTMPQFAIVNCLSPNVGAKPLEKLCKAYGLGSAITAKTLQDFAAAQKMAPDASLTSILQTYAKSTTLPLLLLNGYPGTEADVQEFLALFGAPKVIAVIQCDDEFLDEEAKAADEEADPEAVAAKIASDRAASDGVMKAFQESPAAGCIVTMDRSKPPEEIFAAIQKKLLPTVYIIQAPTGTIDFGGCIAERICVSSSSGGVEDACPEKYTVVDASKLCQRGGHSAAIEAALKKAAFTAETPDCISSGLWVELLTEAFSKSANPMGNFLLTNFPSPCCVKPGTSLTVRDQLSILESVATLGGIAHVKLAVQSYNAYCSSALEDFAAYEAFDAKVNAQTISQFGTSLIFDTDVASSGDAMEAAQKVAGVFFNFRTRSQGTEEEPAPA